MGSLNPECAEIFLSPPLRFSSNREVFFSPGVQNSSHLPSGESSVDMSNSSIQKEWHLLSTGIIYECIIPRYTGERERETSTALPGHCPGRALPAGRHTPTIPTRAGGSSSPAHLTTEIPSCTLLSIELSSPIQTLCWGATLYLMRLMAEGD